MNVLKKRFVPCLLVCVMALAMIAPTFAASNTSTYGTTIDGQYVAATIDVVVPTTGQVFINPYALPVKLSVMYNDGDATPADATESSTLARPGSEASDSSIKNQQIVTEPLFIKNRSEVNLAVSARVTGIVPEDATENNAMFGKNAESNVKFSKEAIKAQTGNEVFAYLQMKVVSDLTDSSTAGDLVAAYTDWTDDTYDKSADLLVGTNENSKSNMVILAAGSETATAGELEATKGSIAMFRIAGQVVTEPKEGWQNTDTFRIQIVFTFKPDPNKPSITTANDDSTINATNGEITLTAELNGGDAEITKVTAWEIVNDTTGKVQISANSGLTTKVSLNGAAAGDSGTATIKATIKADNGLTYTAELKITVEIPD